MSDWRIRETIGLSDIGSRPQSIGLSDIGLTKIIGCPPLKIIIKIKWTDRWLQQAYRLAAGRQPCWQVGNRHVGIKAGGWQEGAGRRKIHK
jgi:hypothetical protein